MKVLLTDLDPLSGKEKSTPTILLVRNDTVRGALKLTEEWQDGVMADTEIEAIRLVSIIDQLPFTKVQVAIPTESSIPVSIVAYDSDIDVVYDSEEEESEGDDETI